MEMIGQRRNWQTRHTLNVKIKTAVICEIVNVRTSTAILHVIIAQIRVSTASCCDLCTEESFEEGAEVKPFAGGELACRQLSGDVTCVE